MGAAPVFQYHPAPRFQPLFGIKNRSIKPWNCHSRSASAASSPRRRSPSPPRPPNSRRRSEEHTSELQSLLRTSYAVFCLKKQQEEQYNKDAFLPLILQ